MKVDLTPEELTLILRALAPREIGEYTVRHTIIARISPNSDQVTIEVSSQEYRMDKGRLVYYKAPESVPEQFFQELKRELGKKP
jgi:hypothetical protein